MIDIYDFFSSLSEQITSKDTIVTDAGSTFNAAAEGIRLKEGTRYIIPGGLAPMGYALPASIGICFAFNKRVICLTGDGSFQLNVQELQSIIHHHLPIKIFYFTNNCYLTIRQTQQRYFNRFIGEGPESGLSFPAIKNIATAYGIPYRLLETKEQLNTAVSETLTADGPQICEIIMEKDQKIIRPLEEA